MFPSEFNLARKSIDLSVIGLSTSTGVSSTTTGATVTAEVTGAETTSTLGALAFLTLGAGRPESSSDSSVTYFSTAAAAPYAGIIIFLYLLGLSFFLAFDLRFALPLGFASSILALCIITVKFD